MNAHSIQCTSTCMYIYTVGHRDDVLAVIERASKDIAVEELLKNLEEVWLSMTFQFKTHMPQHSSEQVYSIQYTTICHYAVYMYMYIIVL